MTRYASAMVIFGLIALETEPVNELPIPPWGIGVITFVLLGVLMVVTLMIGKGRPHA